MYSHSLFIKRGEILLEELFISRAYPRAYTLLFTLLDSDTIIIIIYIYTYNYHHMIYRLFTYNVNRYCYIDIL